MYQVVCGVHSFQGFRHGFRVKDIANNNLDLVGPWTGERLAPAAHEDADMPSLIQQAGNKPSADISSGTGDQDGFLTDPHCFPRELPLANNARLSSNVTENSEGTTGSRSFLQMSGIIGTKSRRTTKRKPPLGRLLAFLIKSWGLTPGC